MTDPITDLRSIPDRTRPTQDHYPILWREDGTPTGWNPTTGEIIQHRDLRTILHHLRTLDLRSFRDLRWTTTPRDHRNLPTIFPRGIKGPTRGDRTLWGIPTR